MPKLLRALAFGVLACAWMVPAVADASSPQALAVFPVELADTSGEPPRPDLAARIASVTGELGRQLAASGRYRPVDLAPYARRLQAAGPLSRCGDCWLEVAREAGADLALVTVVQKMSTLVSAMHVWLVEVDDRHLARKAAVSLRGDTAEAWTRAADYLVRNSLLNDDPSRPSLASPFPGG